MKANKIHKLLARSILITLLSFISLPFSPNGAQANEDNKDRRPAILKVDISDLESIGTLGSLKDGGLGRGLWDNSSREDVIQLLHVLPPPEQDVPASRHLTWGILRSHANADLLTGPFVAESGEDILTARLKKLMEFGAYQDVQNMYSMMSTEPYHPELARLGILSMLYNQGRSVACLEYKIVEDRDFEGEFWDNMHAYCQYVFQENNAQESLKSAPAKVLHSIADDKSSGIPYNKISFGKKDDFERAVLVAEKRLQRPKIGPKTAASLPLQDLGLFLGSPNLSDSERFFTETRAATIGLIGQDMLKKTYQSLYNQSFNGNIQEWQKFIISYHEINDAAKGREQWNIFFNAYEKAGLYGMGALVPFAERIQRFDIGELSKVEALQAIQVLYQADIPIPRKWSEHFLKKENDVFVSPDLALIGIITTPSYRLEEKDIAAFQQVFKQKDEHIQKVLGMIIENLDKRIPNIHNANVIYEKHFDLTFKNNYVMPTLRVWDRLNQSGQNGQIGTTVLLSILILQEWDTGNQYPGFIRDVFENLNTVGLTNVTHSLALGAVLDYIK